MIKVEQLNKVFHLKTGDVIGVEDVSFEVDAGEIFGIVGYSGAGKSTLLRCLNLLERPSSGSIYINDTDLLELPQKELREARQSIGMIFQGFYLVSSKTVYENVSFALKAAGVPKQEWKERVTELLRLVGLEDKVDQFPAQLSGGQKQRVSIARALANNPSVLLCDEATSALDPNTTQSILNLLQKINRELGITIVLITHEMEVVKKICDRCAVMEDGRIVEQASTYKIFSQPKNELTQKFIATVLDINLPDKLRKECTGTVVQLKFIDGLASDSVVSDMLQNNQVTGNILHGKVDYIKDVPLGVFIMELKGTQKEVDQAIDYLYKRLKHVEVIQHGTHR
ncbi:methionine ABC transporter ATP-binding protein [Halalkalibacillus halophilus]|uniref:methionine ABC transporter ATP-binding protein n=1 Tax=Halalkalibacillus halophilus TaxID=392827 RepID=UPI0004210088|nr:methionine ABC transporter ATP-binding protein [Halalkalibacillus halophilus]